MEGLNVEVNMSVPIKVNCRNYAGRIIGIITEEIGGDKFSHHVISAFNEAFNNIIKHSGNTHEDLVTIKVYQSLVGVKIVLEYEGAPFHSNEINITQINPLAESGYGLFIMKSFMSTVEYERILNKNRWIMVKEIASAEDSLSL